MVRGTPAFSRSRTKGSSTDYSDFRRFHDAIGEAESAKILKICRCQCDSYSSSRRKRSPLQSGDDGTQAEYRNLAYRDCAAGALGLPALRRPGVLVVVSRISAEQYSGVSDLFATVRGVMEK